VTDLVLADDHAVFVDALSTVLTRAGFTISAVATTIDQTVEQVGRRKPQVCVIDRHFGDTDSLDAIGSLLAASPRTKVLILSADRNPDGMLRALRAGVSGYLHKTRALAALTGAISEILCDKIVVDLPTAPTVRRSSQEDSAHRLAAHLTAREWECLALLVEGLDTVAMVGRLGVSRTTVRTHVQSLLTKLGVHSRLEAASFATRHRLLDDVPAPTRAARAI
jgi:two-component system nitrate/nitrite response regulator NarL